MKCLKYVLCYFLYCLTVSTHFSIPFLYIASQLFMTCQFQLYIHARYKIIKQTANKIPTSPSSAQQILFIKRPPSFLSSPFLVCIESQRFIKIFYFASQQPQQTLSFNTIYINITILQFQIILMYKLNGPSQIQVYLNVYDLNPSSNETLYPCGLGFYHTGIQLELKEWTFGGHPGNQTGVMQVSPKNNHPNFRQTIFLGKTTYSYRQIYSMLDNIKQKFPGNSYHLIRKNCNTFTNCFTQALLHKDIPSWVDRMAKIGRFFTQTSDFFAMKPYDSRWETAAGELGVKLEQKKDVFASKGVTIG